MCNCKSGKQQKLNNLDSKDHLKVAFDVFNEIVKDKPEDHIWDEADSNVLTQTFYLIYPNVKVSVNPQHAATAIKQIYNQYYGR